MPILQVPQAAAVIPLELYGLGDVTRITWTSIMHLAVQQYYVTASILNPQDVQAAEKRYLKLLIIATLAGFREHPLLFCSYWGQKAIHHLQVVLTSI